MSGIDGDSQALVRLDLEGSGETPEEGQRYVLFRSCDEWFGLPIGWVRGIQPLERVIRVPNAPAEVVGVQNVRGRILSLLDLGACLDIPTGRLPNTYAVVLDLGDPDLFIGLAVQRVGQVQAIPASAVEAPPPRPEGSGILEGVCEWQGQIVSLLDPTRFLARQLQEWGVVPEARAQNS
jgi:purine-binding chemotaxis protein CheW